MERSNQLIVRLFFGPDLDATTIYSPVTKSTTWDDVKKALVTAGFGEGSFDSGDINNFIPTPYAKAQTETPINYIMPSPNVGFAVVLAGDTKFEVPVRLDGDFQQVVDYLVTYRGIRPGITLDANNADFTSTVPIDLHSNIQLADSYPHITINYSEYSHPSQKRPAVPKVEQINISPSTGIPIVHKKVKYDVIVPRYGKKEVSFDKRATAKDIIDALGYKNAILVENRPDPNNEDVRVYHMYDDVEESAFLAGVGQGWYLSLIDLDRRP
jgi:hypothetical protein